MNAKKSAALAKEANAFSPSLKKERKQRTKWMLGIGIAAAALAGAGAILFRNHKKSSSL